MTQAAKLMEKVHDKVGSGFWKPDQYPPMCVSLEVVFNNRILGHTLARIVKHVEAIAAYRKAHEVYESLTPEEMEFAETRAFWYVGSLHRDFAESLVALDRIEEAIAVLGKFSTRCRNRVESLPGLPNKLEREANANVQLGYVYLAGNQPREAESVFHRAIGILETLVSRLPEAKEDRYLLAQLLANCPVEELREPERARTLAYEMSGEDARTTQLKGLCALRAGQCGEAIGWLDKTRGLRKEPDEADALLLSIANAQMSRMDGAEKWLREAAEASGIHASPSLHSWNCVPFVTKPSCCSTDSFRFVRYSSIPETCGAESCRTGDPVCKDNPLDQDWLFIRLTSYATAVASLARPAGRFLPAARRHTIYIKLVTIEIVLFPCDV